MKNSFFKMFLAAAVAVIGFSALPTVAEAGDSHRLSHHCNACNAPIYKRLVFSGHDSCGRPIYRWTLVTHRCAPPRPTVHHHHHDHGPRVSPEAAIISGVINLLIDQSHGRRGRCD